jgi:hypothetical protein
MVNEASPLVRIALIISFFREEALVGVLSKLRLFQKMGSGYVSKGELVKNEK